ncbi:MAG: ferrochelatase [Actinomycetota bacterium]|nr:ferrochelatase [Actinomycetota bacterium]
MPAVPLDAAIVVSFGGPEGPDQVIPFLEHVLRGRNVPRTRLDAVAEHYRLFGGVSPINGQNRALIDALRAELTAHGSLLPVYWGNRNWHPFLADTVRHMAEDGVRHAAAFVTSAYPSWSGCRQYRDDIARAQAEVGAAAPLIDKLRPFFDHPGFVEPFAEALRAARQRAGVAAPVLFSAHSIPQAMADTSDYVAALMETAHLVVDRCGSPTPSWQLVFQSRSGPPTQPWLEPDVTDVIGGLAGRADDVIVAPIGFVSDHMEVVYDLDTQAADAARRAGIKLVRTATPGTHPAFVTMIRELIEEVSDPSAPRRTLTAAVARTRRPGGCGKDCCRRPLSTTNSGRDRAQ